MTTPTRSILKLKRPTAAEGAAAVEERLHKVLANAGLGSRRLLEQRIDAGEVLLNGAAATLGQSVRSGDRVEMDGKRFVVVADNVEHAQVLLYNKPEGVVATRDDPEGRPTVFEQLPHLKGAHWIAVGRLDINTTGLLLLTTDGDLANTLMHPRSEIEREYICRVHGEVPDETIERLRTGIELDDGPARFDQISVISRGTSHSWFRVTLSEGRNREVRRMWESQGLMVSRLKRIRYGHIELPRGLLRGRYEELDAPQVAELRQRSGTPNPEPRLTLAPVIGQRRAAPTEFRPIPKSQQAWTGARQEEAREFAAFDRMRDDGWRPGAGKPGGRKRGTGGPGGGAGRKSAGQQAPRPGRGGPARGGPGRGAPGAAKPKGQRQGQQGPARQNPAFAAEPSLSPAVLRSWFPDSPGQPGRKRRGAKPGAEVTFQAGQFQPAAPQRGPRKFQGGSPGNSIHDGNAPPGSPYGQRPPRGPRRGGGGSPGNSIHDGGNRSGERRPGGGNPGGGNRRRGPRGPR
ncbi:pseudouridine synthase [Dokdonella sp.]|uniref:pseudouridine synthase n=1 Tax=Dokdonella sp. TaxID=2291710 RepID=UPI00261C305F|nr:pseudouridine synthase [Dokdonella sp.]